MHVMQCNLDKLYKLGFDDVISNRTASEKEFLKSAIFEGWIMFCKSTSQVMTPKFYILAIGIKFIYLEKLSFFTNGIIRAFYCWTVMLSIQDIK